METMRLTIPSCGENSGLLHVAAAMAGSRSVYEKHREFAALLDGDLKIQLQLDTAYLRYKRVYRLGTS
jgi:hypothetical protein